MSVSSIADDAIRTRANFRASLFVLKKEKKLDAIATELPREVVEEVKLL